MAQNQLPTKVIQPFCQIQQNGKSSSLYWVDELPAKILPELIKEHCAKAQKILIVSEPLLIEQYLPEIKNQLESSGFEIFSFTFLGGEQNKTPQSLEAIQKVLLQNQFTRYDVCLALGGGIVGDTTGFAAATYRRGMQFIQCPTTLLAQVDASVGGKVGVNFEGYKNMLGAFYPPVAVIISPQFLNTLPQEHLSCGMAEVIKTALIQCSIPGGDHHPNLLEALVSAKSSDELLGDWIKICCQLKAKVVEADPEETLEIREILNLGHTFAHAYEKWFAGYLLHGQAVAFGLVNAFEVAIKMQLLQGQENSLEMIKALLSKFNLQCQPKTPVAIDDLLQLMKQDKKRQGNDNYRLILPYEQLGKVKIMEVSAEDIQAAFK